MAKAETVKQETGLEKREAELPEGVERIREGRQFIPAADIYETNDAVVVQADMPGVSAGSVDVVLEKNVLTIRGAVSREEPGGMSLAYREYVVGDFVRSFSLNDEVDRENIGASVSNGVLTLTLPKLGPMQRRIEVRGE